jgi:GAF domain-containing protein
MAGYRSSPKRSYRESKLGSPSERIIAAVSHREQTIRRQALVMELATNVLGETRIDKAIDLLMAATYQIASCDRVFLFLVDRASRTLVCNAAPAGGAVGWSVPLGQGIVGTVGQTGDTINIANAEDFPELIGGCHQIDAETGYTMVSILCMALKDKSGEVIGVLQAINKRHEQAPPEESGSEDVFVPFDDNDERGLQLLLALTGQQLRVCELISAKETSVEKTQMGLIEEICGMNADIDQSVAALARAVTVTLNCQQVFIFLNEGSREEGSGDLLCRAASPLQSSVGMRMTKNHAVVGRVADNGQLMLLNQRDHADLLEHVQPLMGSQEDVDRMRSQMSLSSASLQLKVGSALCAPLWTDNGKEILGVLIAVNKMVTLSDVWSLAAEAQGQDERSSFAMSPPSPPHAPRAERSPTRRRSSNGREISSASLQAMCLGSILNKRRGSSTEEVQQLAQFEQSDAWRVTGLLRMGAAAVKTCLICSKEQRTTKKLAALLNLLTETSRAVEEREMRKLVLLISTKAREIFECDRCTFFMVDNFTQMLVGHFVTDEGAEDEKTCELRVPMQASELLICT